VDGTSKWPRVIEQNRVLRDNLGAQKQRDGHLNDGFPEVC